MSIATAITDLSGRIQDAYSALSAKGATMPSTKNTYNLPSTISSIPSGGSSDPNTKILYLADNIASNYAIENVVIQGTFSSFPQAVSRLNVVYLHIGDGVSSIAQELCYQGSNLALVEFPTTLKTIQNSAFKHCYRLCEANLPDGLETIGNEVFDSCFKLKSMVIPEGVTTIGSSAFRSCTGLTSVTIPNTVTNIKDYTFQSCRNLSSITIPANVTSIGDGAFEAGASSFTITLEGKTVAQIQAMNPVDWFGWSEMTVTLVGTDGSYQLVISCFKKGTNIALADGTAKKIEDLTYDDVLKVWDFDEGQLGSAKVCWLTRPGLKNDHYYKLTFSDGTVLNTTGRNSNHKIYNVDKRKFEGVDKTQIGDRIYSLNGVVTVVDKQYIEDEVEYYNVMTTGKINCFAEGILASDRYGNMYPIDENMKYIKDGRAIRPYSDYEAVGIDKYWYDNLRLGEVPETVEETKNYVMKVVNQMLPLPTGDVS